MKCETDITIFCLTYNHVQYIRDAFEGFLNQKTQFTFNIFVYDDASTDGTSDIVREYKDKYPDIFNIYISEKNLYKATNREIIMMELYEKYIRGKYVAWCEGDDYWIDPYKLQLQVQYMEEHPECSMTAHGAVWLDCQNNKKKDYLPFEEEKDLTAEEIILQPTGNLSTASLVMQRKIFMRDVDYPRCGVMDRPLQLYALYHGKIHFFSKIMSVYRYMHEGSWSMEVQRKFCDEMLHYYDMIRFLKEYDSYTHQEYHKYIRRDIISYLYVGVNSFLKMKESDYRFECKKLDVKTDSKYHNYLTQQCRVFSWFKGEYILSKEEREQINNNTHVVIMGVGEYSHYVEKILSKNQVTYSGYIVSYKQDAYSNSKSIWQLADYPYEKEKTLVIVGIHQKSEESVLKVLEDNHFNNFITPMWIYNER